MHLCIEEILYIIQVSYNKLIFSYYNKLTESVKYKRIMAGKAMKAVPYNRLLLPVNQRS